MNPFKGQHFQRDIILWAVHWYCKYGISYRELLPLNVCAERQVITLNSLREYFSGQMLILRYLSADFIGSGTKSVGQYAACFGVVRIPEPTKLHCASSSQISATSAWATGEDVVRFDASFLKSG